MSRSQKTAKTLCRTRGLTQDLIVTKEGNTITLWSEAGIRHTVFDITAPHIPGLEYARNMLAVLAFCPHAQSFLVLGLGGGSIPRMLLKARPRIRVDAVEVDPVIVDLAAEYFDIRTSPRLAVHLQDAAGFLNQCTSQYDVVIVDTYLGEQLPVQCSTEEFIGDAGKCLVDGGVLAVNWLSEDTRKRRNLLKMIGSIIGPVWQLNGLKSHNVLYFATAEERTRSAIVSAAAKMQPEIPFENTLRKLAHRLQNIS